MLVKPLLRWAGGKRWLATRIKQYLPEKINNYYEPFCGSCSIFYSLKDVIGNKKIFLSDLNGELINFYKVLQGDPGGLIAFLRQYENTETCYYSIRSLKTENRIEAAARFYYLNRTSFNGIYRVNLNGEYNVPFGFKGYAELFDEDLIYRNSEFVKDVVFVHDDFSWMIESVEPNDFVFVDPPYTVSHNRNGFIKYNRKLFSVEDQQRLKGFLEAVGQVQAKYLLTNAHHSFIYDIFSLNSKEEEISRYTPISGGKKGREFTKEYIFINYGLSSNGDA